MARAAEAGLAVTPTQVFQHPTIAELAAHAELSAPAGEPDGPLPLSGVQRALLAEAGGDPRRLNRLLVLEPGATVEAGLLRQALAHLRDRHQALRMRLDAAASTLVTAPDQPADEPLVELVQAADGAHDRTVRAVAERLVAALDVTASGPVRLALVDAGPGRRQRLLVATSALLLDEAGVDVVLDGLAEILEELAAGRPPRPATGDRRFAAWLREVGGTRGGTDRAPVADAGGPAGRREVEVTAIAGPCL